MFDLHGGAQSEPRGAREGGVRGGALRRMYSFLFRSVTCRMGPPEKRPRRGRRRNICKALARPPPPSLPLRLSQGTGARDETCPVSTGGRGGGAGASMSAPPGTRSKCARAPRASDETTTSAGCSDTCQAARASAGAAAGGTRARGCVLTLMGVRFLVTCSLTSSLLPPLPYGCRVFFWHFLLRDKRMRGRETSEKVRHNDVSN